MEKTDNTTARSRIKASPDGVSFLLIVVGILQSRLTMVCTLLLLSPALMHKKFLMRK